MAETLIQVSDLEEIGSLVGSDFLHIKQFSDNGDYKISTVNFSSSLSNLLGLGTFALIDQSARSISTGNGLTGGGDLTASRTLTLGTPSTITDSSTNSTSTSSHTHKLQIGGRVLKGGIIMFAGEFSGKNPIPKGGILPDTDWQICDGTNGTPNMINRFPIGSGGLYLTGSTGGSADSVVVAHNHSATVNDPGHTHTYSFRDDTGVESQGPSAPNDASLVARQTGPATTGITVGINTTGESGVNKNLPPYYAVAFIQRIN